MLGKVKHTKKCLANGDKFSPLHHTHKFSEHSFELAIMQILIFKTSN